GRHARESRELVRQRVGLLQPHARRDGGPAPGEVMKFKRLADQELRGKRVFIRADLNVPQDDGGAITDDTRIRASVPGIQLALEKGAAVMVTSHLGRPTEGEFK